MSQDIFTLKIGGQAGQGIKTAGNLFARFANRSGYHVFDHVEYPSIIRGGHNVMQINFCAEPVTAAMSKTDLLIALNQDTIDKHIEELTQESGIVYDKDDKYDLSSVPGYCTQYPVPLSALAKEAGGGELLVNTVALGAATGILDGDLAILKKLIEDEYGHKGEEIVNADKKAAKLGFTYAQENFANALQKDRLCSRNHEEVAGHMVLNGNEAVALGAIAAGVQFAAIYPMSPISNILHVLAKHQEEYGYVYKQPEDEISAINMAIGASFAGARSMTATSGGGFCLMSEGYGLAGITETPIVIVEGMRGGPGTGIPTWSGQGDLRMVLHAHQDDFPRIVLAPGDTEETFYMTMKAFNLAEKYQTPVVVLINKDICESDTDVQPFDISDYVVDRGKFTREKLDVYERYAHVSDGISLRSIPGSGNFMVANSDEHNPIGYSTEEIDERNAQMQKRMQKLITCAEQDMDEPQLFGPKDADVTLVSWGSNKGAILEGMKQFDTVNFLHVTWMNPFPVDAVKDVLTRAKHVVVVEADYSGQFAGLLTEKTGVAIEDNLRKYDGRPFYPIEIERKVQDVLKGGI